MTAEQKDVYVAHLRVQEITARLRLPETVFQEQLLQQQQQRRRRRGGCDVSPDPEYDNQGRRTNTRIQRHRAALERERNDLLTRLTTALPGYQAPAGYRRPTRYTDRVFIPQREHPEVKFIGQILGPRGRDLKKLEEKSDAVMKIRGKGSVKEGKTVAGRRTTATAAMEMIKSKNYSARDDNSDNMLLHVLITANAQDKVDKAKKLVQAVIDDAVNKPDWMNQRKLTQMRGLAEANGTLRDDEGFRAGSLIAYYGAQADIRGDAWNGDVTDSSTVTLFQDVSRPEAIQNATCAIDLEEEHRLMMQDIQGQPSSAKYATNTTNTTAKASISSALPPWRVDRMRQQSIHY